MKTCQASTPDQIGLARMLFEEYGGWLGIDLSCQGFAAELTGLPGRYAPPGGRLLLAMTGDDTASCAALRPLGDGTCEMKRLFVRQEFRGRGLGKILAARVVQEARTIGYQAGGRRKQIPPVTFEKRLRAVKLHLEEGFTQDMVAQEMGVSSAALHK